MKIIECPRDAMQGLDHFIPTDKKISYINQLLKIGFDTIDFGSFVSPKAIPQMRDTAEVVQGLKLEESSSRLLAIVANLRGAREASAFDEIDYLGFPLSLSETFQIRNTNQTIDEGIATVESIQSICNNSKKVLVVYLSMGFGNPYNDPYDPQVVIDFTEQLQAMGVRIISLADTIGVSTVEGITDLFETLVPEFPNLEFGAHLHSNPLTANKKIQAAYQAGCRRFDGALGGFGGCPMAEDELVGNIATESLLASLAGLDVTFEHDHKAFENALAMVPDLFHPTTNQHG